MDLGPLNEMVRIESATSATDPLTEALVTVWAEFVTVPASIKDVLPTNAENVENTIRVGYQPTRVRFRYIPGITADMRVILLERGGIERRIVSGPAILGRNEGIELMVESYTMQGSRV
jgi:head-tail adaptor